MDLDPLRPVPEWLIGEDKKKEKALEVDVVKCVKLIDTELT